MNQVVANKGFMAAAMLVLTLVFVLVEPVAADIYMPIWGKIRAQAGTASQSDGDLIINSVDDLDSPNLSCTRVRPGGRSGSSDDYIYSITLERDFDGDDVNDVMSFDLRVEGFSGSTYVYDPDGDESSMTALGDSADVNDISSRWGVGGDDDIDAGQSLRFTVENLTCSAGSVVFQGLTSAELIEVNEGYSHAYIIGEGTGLDSGQFNTTTHSVNIDAADANEFVITGAGSNVSSRQWALESIYFLFRGPLGRWDVTDYSYYKIGSAMLDEYPAQTDFSNYPEFSWDTVPRWIIVRKHIAWAPEEIEALATYPLIVWEKENSAEFDNTEEGVLATTARVKAINPSVKCIFYRNSNMHYGGYAANDTYDEWNYSQHTTDASGNEVLYYEGDTGRLMYNHDVAAMRDWWVYDSALPTVLDDTIDGIFYDKCGYGGYIYDDQGEPASNYIKTLDTMDQELPPGKLAMGNTLRNERTNGSRDLMRILEGSYLERWSLPLSGYGQVDRIDGTCVSMQLMMEASLKGKFICFKTGHNSGALTREEMQEDMPYQLALYLIVAGQYSYYAYQDHVAAHTADYHWETSWMPEFNRPLGPPLGQAIKDGYVYSRSFEHMDVWVDVESMDHILAWDSVDTDGDDMDDLWEYRNFGDTTVADPNGDPDGDGATNLEEHDAGTDPNRPFRSFVEFTAEMGGETARFQAYIPKSVEHVKAAFYISQHGQGDITHPVLQQFAEDANLALLGFYGDPVQRGVADVSVLDEHIATLAELSGHAELPSAPIMTFGHSNGTGFAGCWPRDRTDQVICWTSFHPGFTDYLEYPNTEVVPALIMCGELDDYFLRSRQDITVANMRSTRNAAMAVMLEGGMSHSMPNKDSVWGFIVEFCKASMRIRLAEDGTLRPVDIESGWLGETYDVEVGGRQFLDIASYDKFAGDPSTANWLFF